MPVSRIEINYINGLGKDYICLKSDVPSFFVDLYHPKISFSDRGFILLPGEEKIIEISNDEKREIDFKEINISVLNNYLSD